MRPTRLIFTWECMWKSRSRTLILVNPTLREYVCFLVQPVMLLDFYSFSDSLQFIFPFSLSVQRLKRDCCNKEAVPLLILVNPNKIVIRDQVLLRMWYKFIFLFFFTPSKRSHLNEIEICKKRIREKCSRLFETGEVWFLLGRYIFLFHIFTKVYVTDRTLFLWIRAAWRLECCVTYISECVSESLRVYWILIHRDLMFFFFSF